MMSDCVTNGAIMPLKFVIVDVLLEVVKRMHSHPEMKEFFGNFQNVDKRGQFFFGFFLEVCG